LTYAYVVAQHESDVELYIDRGKDCKDENKAIFNSLKEHQKEIESDFGEPLEWEILDAKRASRIAKYFELGGYRDEETKWPCVQDAMIDAMIRLEKALHPYIAKLKDGPW
jgi:hypothetical protein